MCRGGPLIRDPHPRGSATQGELGVGERDAVSNREILNREPSARGWISGLPKAVRVEPRLTISSMAFSAAPIERMQ